MANAAVPTPSHHDTSFVAGTRLETAVPIMLTALTAVLALIPISRGLFWGPMAYAMMGGILVATVLTILVLPAAYALFFGREPKQKDEAPAQKTGDPVGSFGSHHDLPVAAE